MINTKIKDNSEKPSDLHEEIHDAIKSVNGWGSVEIYIQDNKVTQITTRAIKKTEHTVNPS